MNTAKSEKEMCSSSGVLVPLAVVMGPMNSVESCTYKNVLLFVVKMNVSLVARKVPLLV